MFQRSTAYGSIGQEQRLDGNQQRRSRFTRSSAVNIIVGGLIGYYCISVYNTLQSQQIALQNLQAALHTNQLDLSGKKKERNGPVENVIPHKFAIKHVTPRKTQDHRGTCWAFATVALLEQTYRAQGIENGWLEPNKYVALSEQAYGEEIIRLCSGPFDSAQQIACRVPGDSMWENSTEGGEAAELFYLVNGLKDSVFPVDVCPYQPSLGHDTVCPGLAKAKLTNPLSFTITNMETIYDLMTVKQRLFEKKQSMTFTTAMPYVTHYYPCIREFANDPRCDQNSPTCHLCPKEMPMTTCCIPLRGGTNYNMHGEFIAHGGMTLEGGHLMLLVGYNDNYRTKDGFTGGFILKNSWFDGVAPPLAPHIPRGSHSMRYWMEQISDWEERTICPNSHSPYNWYQCGNAESVTGGHRSGASPPPPGRLHNFNRSNAFKEGIQACLSNETKLYAEVNVQPLHLKCNSSEFCNTSPDYTYFVRNMTEWGDRMTVMCMFEYNEKTQASRDFCMIPMLVQTISKLFTPLESRENDPDRCGFYFFPYEVVREYVALFEGFYVNHFEITWHPRSYAANAEVYEPFGYDYTLIKRSTKTQNEYNFVGPFPFAHVVT